MKKYIKYPVNLFLMCCSFFVFGQQAQFETPFYFEDAIGNRDTIIIGADTSADEIVNAHLGEILLSAPWDSTFEVRVAREDNYHNALWFGETLNLFNKKITYLFDVPTCGYSTSVIFLINATHYPVTVTWDTTVWSFSNSPCPLDGSFFHHTDDILEPGWWPLYNYACLGSRSSFQFDTTDSEPYAGIIDSVSGIGMEFIYGLQLRRAELENPISPCYLEVATQELSTANRAFIYPNPTAGSILLRLEDALSLNIKALSIRNYFGIEVWKVYYSAEFFSPISIENLPAGVYFASLIGQHDELIMTQKLIIII